MSVFKMSFVSKETYFLVIFKKVIKVLISSFLNFFKKNLYKQIWIEKKVIENIYLENN